MIWSNVYFQHSLCNYCQIWWDRVIGESVNKYTNVFAFVEMIEIVSKTKNFQWTANYFIEWVSSKQSALE
jgi:hypothetical protein